MTKRDKQPSSPVLPLRDRVVVRRDEGEKSLKHGSLELVLPDQSVERPMTGVIVSVGAGRLEIGPDGKIVEMPMELREGQRVLLGRYAGIEYIVGEATYVMVREGEVLGVVAG